MKKLWMILVVAFVCSITVVAAFYHRSVSVPNSTDSLNKPVRIVSLAPNITEILFALGLDEEIVAVSSNSDYPPEAVSKNKVGTFWQPNTEAIIASRPDLVITLWFEQQKAVADSLSRLGYQVLTLKIEKIEELFTAIQKIGDVTGKHLEAEELVMDIKNHISPNEQRTTSDQRRIKVLWVVQAEPLRVAGRNTFVNELIELAGGENAISHTIDQYPQISTEELIVCGAEVIIQPLIKSGAMGNNIERQQQTAHTFWSKYPNLPAVKNNRIYVVKPDTILRLGPRLGQGVKLIANCLYPDRNSE